MLKHIARNKNEILYNFLVYRLLPRTKKGEKITEFEYVSENFIYHLIKYITNLKFFYKS